VRAPDLSSLQYRTLRAVAVLTEQEAPLSMRTIGRQAGIDHPSEVWRHMRRLRELGLVHFEDGRQGTVRLDASVVFVGDDLCVAEALT